MLTKYPLPQPYKVHAATKETRGLKRLRDRQRVVWLSHRSLSNRREAPGLSPAPHKTDKRKERDRANERGRGRMERGERKKETCLAFQSLSLGSVHLLIGGEATKPHTEQ